MRESQCVVNREQVTHDLRRANEFHVALLAMAGHDLRQPLQVVISSYDWLSRRVDKDLARKHLDRGQSAITQLIELGLDHLVSALRLHERESGIEGAPVALGPIFAALERDQRDFANQGDVRLDVVPTQAAIISGEVLLEGILRNLTRNALKYTHRHGRVLGGCRRRGTELRIEVHDTGVGMPPDKLASVFQAFYRLDSTQPNGLGLGCSWSGVPSICSVIASRFARRSAADRCLPVDLPKAAASRAAVGARGVTEPPGGFKNRQKLTVVRAGLPCVCFRPRADSWTAPSREDTVMKLHPRSAARSLVFAGAMVIAVAGFLAVEPSRGLSQGVAMVKVDVSLVAKGYRASKLIGSGVVNDKNEKIGTLDDIIIDHSRVMAGVLQVGGFLGIGSRRVAVPYENLQIDDTGGKIVLPEATREELQKLAEFKYES